MHRLYTQEHGFYRKLTGMAMQLLKQGKTEEEAFEQLCNDFIPPAPSVEAPKRERVSKDSFPDELLEWLFSKPLEEQEIERAPVPDHRLGNL